jgi:hypothetical protein
MNWTYFLSVPRPLRRTSHFPQGSAPVIVRRMRRCAPNIARSLLQSARAKSKNGNAYGAQQGGRCLIATSVLWVHLIHLTTSDDDPQNDDAVLAA